MPDCKRIKHLKPLYYLDWMDLENQNNYMKPVISLTMFGSRERERTEEKRRDITLIPLKSF